ncbi:ribulose bisphosphate carboxylase small subunit, chloroplastic-like [Arachis stenosperma]|uniref:ribulose bisphosphate carboxylase small subunit, chloroplastic-like n=1 Tax=Arachis stenosperma TaxID=217475 RepID=UPI0025ABD19B|nr:ribulose bisphosphate carboxylase small subunit, chloroplastic-like [Arachis stenosperma]
MHLSTFKCPQFTKYYHLSGSPFIPLYYSFLHNFISASFKIRSTFSLRNMYAGSFAAPVSGAGYVGLKSNSSNLYTTTTNIEWCKTKNIVSNGSKTHCMKTWNPINNRKFETLSYLPPLSDESIGKEIDYMLKKGWTPCLEFDEVGCIRRENSRMPGYYDGRYWTLWKLPFFGCTDSSQVMNEIKECKEQYPNAYIRCLAFDDHRHMQAMAFLIHKPPST